MVARGSAADYGIATQRRREARQEVEAEAGSAVEEGGDQQDGEDNQPNAGEADQKSS